MVRRQRYRSALLTAGTVLVVALLATAAACSTGNGGGGGTASSSPASAIVVGADASLSGPLAGFGAYEKWAFDAVIADINAQGGVTVDGLQHKVTGVLLDDKSDPNVAAGNIDTLVTKNGAVALLGPVTPAVSNAASLAAEQQGVPYVETGSQLEPFRAVKPQWKWAFDFFFAAPDLAAGAFQWPKDLGIDRQTNMKYVVSVDNSPDGPLFIKQIEAAGKAGGWTLAMSETHPSNSTQFGGLIDKLKASGADYIIVLGDTQEHVALRKQMDAAGYKPKILYLVRGAQQQQFADALGALANGASATATVIVVPAIAGLITNSATVALTNSGGTLVMDTNLANNSTTVITTVNAPAVTNLSVQVLGPIVFNRQTGLFEQPIRFNNLSGTPITGVRISLGGLPSDLVLYNASGASNGVPFVEYDQIVSAGGSVGFVLEYYRSSRLAFVCSDAVRTGQFS